MTTANTASNWGLIRSPGWQEILPTFLFQVLNDILEMKNGNPKDRAEKPRQNS